MTKATHLSLFHTNCQVFAALCRYSAPKTGKERKVLYERAEKPGKTGFLEAKVSWPWNLQEILKQFGHIYAFNDPQYIGEPLLLLRIIIKLFLKVSTTNRICYFHIFTSSHYNPQKEHTQKKK